MSTEDRLKALEEELSRVKRRTRRLLQGVVCLFVAGGVLAVLSITMGSAKAQGEKVIRADKFIAKAFVVEDQHGKFRAMLMEFDTGPGLALLDQNEKMQALLGAGDKGPALALLDQNGKTRAGLLVANTGPSLSLFDQKGNAIWRAP